MMNKMRRIVALSLPPMVILAGLILDVRAQEDQRLSCSDCEPNYVNPMFEHHHGPDLTTSEKAALTEQVFRDFYLDKYHAVKESQSEDELDRRLEAIVQVYRKVVKVWFSMPQNVRSIDPAQIVDLDRRMKSLKILGISEYGVNKNMPAAVSQDYLSDASYLLDNIDRETDAKTKKELVKLLRFTNYRYFDVMSVWLSVPVLANYGEKSIQKPMRDFLAKFNSDLESTRNDASARRKIYDDLDRTYQDVIAKWRSARDHDDSLSSAGQKISHIARPLSWNGDESIVAHSGDGMALIKVSQGQIHCDATNEVFNQMSRKCEPLSRNPR